MSKKKKKAGRELPVLQKPKKPKYDCNECAGYCCSYDLIEITKADAARLAKHHGLPVEEAKRKFTKPEKRDGKEILALRHREDFVYSTTCMFLHPKKRICTVYSARPGVCRSYPHGDTCGYFQFLMWEREHQDDPDFVATT